MYQFGTGYLFVSAAFDDKNNTIAVRLSIPSNSNLQFPAKDNGFLKQMYDLKDSFVEENVVLGDPFVMPIDNVSLIKIMADSPVASVQFYKTLFEVQYIFLMPISTQHT